MDTLELENAAELSLTAFCWWRADLPREVSETYWRDVHGIMFARAAGMWQSRQLRLAANRPDLWPAVGDIGFEVPEVAQPQGIGHGLFRSESELEIFAHNPIPGELIPNDARTFIGRIGSQLSPPGGGRTLVDRIDDRIRQGSPPAPTFVLGIVAREPDSPTEPFHDSLTGRLARAWSVHPDVLRLRFEPLPPYGESVMASPGVPHEWPSEETYRGWIELAVRHEGVLARLLADLPDDHTDQIGGLHTYPVREVYTLVSAGRPTEVGLRGYPAARAIEAAGAENQRSDATLRLLYGEAARGLG